MKNMSMVSQKLIPVCGLRRGGGLSYLLLEHPLGVQELLQLNKLCSITIDGCVGIVGSVFFMLLELHLQIRVVLGEL